MAYDTADFYKIVVQEISESDINRLLKLAFEKGGKEKYFFLSGVSKSLWGNLNLLAVNWV